jgi:hypothetical protein
MSFATEERSRIGRAKVETTVRYIGVEVDDALRLAEQIEL